MIPWLTNFFGSPWLLWGVGLAGAPLVIHLLYRRRFRETPWAAMRFLLEAARKNARRLQVEQWLLLALRTLILLVAVLALAEPHLRQAGAVFQAGLPTHRIVVVDASASMGAVDQDQSLFENARRLAREVLDQSRPGDAVNLVRLSALPPRVIVQTPSFNPDSVRGEIDRLELSATPAAVAAALEETLPLLQAVPEISRKQVYFISDFQRASWEPDRGGGDGRLAVAARKISESAELFLLDAGSSPLPNAALTSCELIDRVPLVNRPTRLRVGVRNYAAESRDMDLQLLVDDRVVERRTLSLGPAPNRPRSSRSRSTAPVCIGSRPASPPMPSKLTITAGWRRMCAIACASCASRDGRRNGQESGGPTISPSPSPRLPGPVPSPSATWLSQWSLMTANSPGRTPGCSTPSSSTTCGV